MQKINFSLNGKCIWRSFCPPSPLPPPPTHTEHRTERQSKTLIWQAIARDCRKSEVLFWHLAKGPTLWSFHPVVLLLCCSFGILGLLLVGIDKNQQLTLLSQLQSHLPQEIRLFQWTIGGAPIKFKNHPRPFFRPRSIQYLPTKTQSISNPLKGLFLEMNIFCRPIQLNQYFLYMHALMYLTFLVWIWRLCLLLWKSKTACEFRFVSLTLSLVDFLSSVRLSLHGGKIRLN
jgi:hypothetical protein